MTTVRQPTKRRRSCVLTLKYTFICVYWWTRQRIHNTLIVVDRYLRLMGDKTIPDSAEPRLESFYPPFVAGIDLPHQGVVDSYNLHNGISYTGKMTSLYWIRALMSGDDLERQGARASANMLFAHFEYSGVCIVMVKSKIKEEIRISIILVINCDCSCQSCIRSDMIHTCISILNSLQINIWNSK